MTDLNFEVYDAEPLTFAVSPQLIFKLRIRAANENEKIQNIALRCQIQIEAPRRRYSEAEQAHLSDLFGEPSRWSKTLKTMLWTHSTVTVPPFTGSTAVDLPVECTFDFNIASTKYFAGLEDGEIPLLLQFSGTLFYAGENGDLQIAQIPWSAETKYRLPVKVWQTMMEHYYPNSAWLNLRRDVFDRLQQYKISHAIPTFEQVLERLLPVTDETENEFFELDEEMK
ncbi:MAG TPA: DUF6084 family protein [Pyrinomonadaceae bacterium]|nr:DUF6084 family protein [Pyrinomonadaceae bacterium]